MKGERNVVTNSGGKIRGLKHLGEGSNSDLFAKHHKIILKLPFFGNFKQYKDCFDIAFIEDKKSMKKHQRPKIKGQLVINFLCLKKFIP